MAITSVEHAGRTVVSSNEGGWVYTPGHKGNNNEPRVNARASRAKLKRLSMQPATHSLSVDYVGNQSDWSGFRNRIEDLYDDSVGTLSVPGHPSVFNCAFTGQPSFSEQKAVEDGSLMTVDMEVVEL